MEDFGLSGKAAIVTGSTKGIGASIAKKLASFGVEVVVSGRTVSAGKSIVETIRDRGGEATFVKADVRNLDDIRELVDACHRRYGNVDILVNNASVETDTKPDQVDLSTWESLIETDFRAYWYAANCAYPLLKESQGVIVNIGSNHSRATQPKKFPYNAIKAGIDGMTRSMAVAWGADGIRVNSINPGWTKVTRIDESLSDEDLEKLEQIHPIGRIGKPTDVANAVAFLASPMAAFITGHCLVVDGGRSAVLQDDLYTGDLDLESRNY